MRYRDSTVGKTQKCCWESISQVTAAVGYTVRVVVGNCTKYVQIQDVLETGYEKWENERRELPSRNQA